MADSAMSSTINSLAALNSLFGGGNKTSTTTTRGGGGSTTTKQTKLSQDAINALLQNILGGVQGLSAVTSGQKKSGMYNSTVNELLSNDLLTRAAGQVAVASAPTVTTVNQQPLVQTQNQKTAQTGQGNTLMALAGLYGANKLLKSDTVQNIIGGNSGSSGGGGVVSGAVAGGADAISNILTDNLTAGIGASASDAAAIAAGNMFTGDTASALSGLFESGSSAAGSSAAGGITGSVPIGPIISLGSDIISGKGLTTSTVGSAVGGWGGSEIGGAIGTAILPGIGTAIGSFLGGAIGSLGGSGCFITTAVCEVMGKPDDCYELETLRNFRDSWLKHFHPKDIALYYANAPRIVSRIKQLAHSNQLFTAMYTQYIIPAVHAIETSEPAAAYEIYKALYLYAEKQASLHCEG